MNTEQYSKEMDILMSDYNSSQDLASVEYAIQDLNKKYNEENENE